MLVELKRGGFKPEYSGKMNFYLNLVNDKLKHKDDNPSIGLILCSGQNGLTVDYALKGLESPMGVATFEYTGQLPDELQGSLPTSEELTRKLKDHLSHEDETNKEAA